MVQVSGYSEDDTEILSIGLEQIMQTSLKTALAKTAASLQPALTASSSAGLGPADVSVFNEYWLAEVDGEILPYVSQVYTGSAVSVAVGLADGFPFPDNPGVPLVADEWTMTYLKTVTGDVVSVGDDAWEDVRSVLIQGVQDGESIPQIAAKIQHVGDFTSNRATEIARTVTHSAAESGSIGQLRFIGYTDQEVEKEWLCTHDARTRPNHLAADKQKVPLSGKFTVGGTHLDFPGDPSGAYTETRNCRCTTLFNIDDAPKFRCSSGLVAAATPTTHPTASQCVVPTPDVDVSHVIPATKKTINDTWDQVSGGVTPGYGGAAIYKALVKTRETMKAAGFAEDALPNEWEMLKIIDAAHPSKGAFTYSEKFSSWLQSPAGAKTASHIHLPSTHAITPVTPTTPVVPATAPKLPSLPPVAPKPNPGDIKFTGKTLGSHGAEVWQNPKTGEKWLFKPQKQYATDIDLATSRLQSAALETRPGVYEIELNGQKGSIQYMFDSQEAFPHGSFDPLTLSAADIETLQQGQIYDWLISNFDTHSGQWIRLKDGQLFGTDKGQAFKFFGSDKLDWDYVPVYPLGDDKLTYSAMWKAFVQGKKIEMQDPTTGALGAYIDRLMAVPDDKLREMFRAYAEVKGKPNPEAFLDALVTRKQQLKADFKEFYDRAVAARAKALGLPPVPKPVPGAPSVVLPAPADPFAAVADLGDISAIKANAKAKIVQMWESAGGGKKVTPGWGGSKVWKMLDEVKADFDSYAVANNVQPLSELQILRVMDEAWGFKGKPKSYESVVLDWLDSSAGKKVVPKPPISLSVSKAVPITTPKPVPVTAVSPLSTKGMNPDVIKSLANGHPSTSADLHTNSLKIGKGKPFAYGAGPDGTTYRITVDPAFPDEWIVESFEPQSGTWIYWDNYDWVHDISQVENLTDQWIIPAVPKAPVSKIPGLMPGDPVAPIDIEASKYLWKDGEIIARTDPNPNTGAYHTLVADGKGGVTHYVYDSDGVEMDTKFYPDSSQLHNMPGIKAQQWKIGDSTVTPSVGPKVKPSPIPGKNAGDVLSLDDYITAPQHSSSPIQLAYSYDAKTQVESVLWIYPDGTKVIKIRSAGEKVFSDLFNSLDNPNEIEAMITHPKATWYTATETGGQPDAYKIALSGKPGGSAVPGVAKPSAITGKVEGQDVTVLEIKKKSYGKPGDIVATHPSATGVGNDARVIVDVDGDLVIQEWDGSVWQHKAFLTGPKADTASAFSDYKTGWKAALDQAVPPAKKIVLKANESPFTQAIGDKIKVVDILDQDVSSLDDGTVVAKLDIWGEKYRLVVIDGKLVQQKFMPKTGNWAGNKLIKTQSDIQVYWVKEGDYGWNAGNVWKVTSEHLDPPKTKSLKTFVAKKKVLAKPSGKKPSYAPGGGVSHGAPTTTLKFEDAIPGGYTPTVNPDVTKFVAQVESHGPKMKDLIPQHVDISGISQSFKDEMLKTRIGINSPAETIFDQLEGVMKRHNAAHPNDKLTLAQVVRIFDESRAQRNGFAAGSAEARAYETKVVDWWTREGYKRGWHPKQAWDAPVYSRDLPSVMHRLDAPGQPDFDSVRYRVLSDSDARAMQADMEGKYGPVSTAQARGVADYTGGHFREINHAIRDGKVAGSTYEAEIRQTVGAFRPSTIGVKLFRATGWSEFFDSSITSEGALQSYVGRTFAWRRMVSTTIRQKRTYSVKQDIILHIDAPPGTPMVYAQAKGGQASEYEMILAPHTMFKIMKVYKVGGQVHADVRVVGVADAAVAGGI